MLGTAWIATRGCVHLPPGLLARQALGLTALTTVSQAPSVPVSLCMAAAYVPRAVALQGPSEPLPKRRRMDMAGGSAADASPREAAGRVGGHLLFARVLPAMYVRDCSTAAQAAAIASGEPLPSPPKPAQAPRPTHFLALQVSHAPSVVEAIGRVQAAVCKHSPHLQKACVDAVSSHLTLGVMALHGEEDIAHAEETLRQLSGVLSQEGLLAPLELTLGGLSHFRNQVLYLDVEEGGGLQRLHSLAAAVRSHFNSAGLLQQADRPFVPHVTIAKLSKLPRGGKDRQRRWERKGKGKDGGGNQEGKGEDWDEGSGHERNKKEKGNTEALPNTDMDAEAALALAERKAELQVGAAAAGGEKLAGGKEAANTEQQPPSAAADAEAAATVSDAREGGCGTAAGGSDVRSMHVIAEDREQRHEAGNQQQKSDQQGGREGSKAGIPPESYAALGDISGGTVNIAELQLCQMQGRRPGEYYPVLARLALVADGQGDAVVVRQARTLEPAGELGAS